VINGTSLDLTSTTLSSIETLKAGNTAATTFTVDQADLISGGSVIGSTGSDTLATAGTTLDLSSTSINSIEILKAGTATATTFTVDAKDLAVGGSVIGGTTAGDTLIVKNSAFDLTSTTLTGIEVLKAGVAGTTFTLEQTDLNALGTTGQVVGGSGKDTLQVADTTIDLTSTTLTSVEVLAAGSTAATTFIVDQADLLSKGSVVGTAKNDTLEINGSSLNLTSTTLTSVEILKAHLSTATSFTVDPADVSGGSVVGSTGNDTLILKTTAFDLTSTTLTSIETLQAGLATATTFTVDQTQLASAGSVIGSSGKSTKATASSPRKAKPRWS